MIYMMEAPPKNKSLAIFWQNLAESKISLRTFFLVRYDTVFYILWLYIED